MSKCNAHNKKSKLIQVISKKSVIRIFKKKYLLIFNIIKTNALNAVANIHENMENGTISSQISVYNNVRQK